MQKVIDNLNTYIFGPALPIFIFIIGSFLFVKYGSFIIFKIKTVISVLTRKNSENGISPFKTAMLALASTLGVGNIVGVSTAIFSGGPGAVFWLTLSAFAAMPLKYGEIVLAMKYRKTEEDEYRGGAMYYINECLGKRSLSYIFALLCVVNALTVGNVVQINAVAESFKNVFFIDPKFVGFFASVLIFFSIKRGTRGVSEITSKLVPVATLAYIGISLGIIAINLKSIPYVWGIVFKEAFNVKALFGGVGGYGIIRAMRYGVARGIMSNEAGSGTAPTAHAKSNLKSPVEQGFWGLFEVFADTVVMCNMTALVILFSFEKNVLQKGQSGMELVIRSYGNYLGDTAGLIIVFSVILFAYATVIAQGFYGGEAIYYITKNKRILNLFNLVYSLTVIYGAVAKSGVIWGLTDLNISVMTLINTVCILMCARIIKKETDDYFLDKKRLKKRDKKASV